MSYDIPEDRKRTKVANIMKDFGERVQYSVFECIINDDKLLDKMTAKLSALLSEEDSVRIYALCGKCEKVVKVLGGGSITKDQNVFIL